MHELLCVLLYLALISSPDEFYQAEIYQIESDNQAQVDAVENNQTLYNQVIIDYDDDAEYVTIWDFTSN